MTPPGIPGHKTTDLATDLIFSQTFIDGQWRDSDTGATHPVTNPATGETIATAPDMGRRETTRIIAAANAALPAWRL